MDLTLRRGTGAIFLIGGELLPTDVSGDVDFTTAPALTFAKMLVGNTDAGDEVNGVTYSGWSLGGGFQDLQLRQGGTVVGEYTLLCTITTDVPFGGAGGVQAKIELQPVVVNAGITPDRCTPFGVRFDDADGAQGTPFMYNSVTVNPIVLDVDMLTLGSIALLTESSLDSYANPATTNIWYPVESPLRPTRTQAVIVSAAGGSV